MSDTATDTPQDATGVLSEALDGSQGRLEGRWKVTLSAGGASFSEIVDLPLIDHESIQSLASWLAGNVRHQLIQDGSLHPPDTDFDTLTPTAEVVEVDGAGNEIPADVPMPEPPQDSPPTDAPPDDSFSGSSDAVSAAE